LKADAANQKKLADKLASLSVRPAQGNETSPLAPKILGRKFVFPTNEQKLESITLTSNRSGKGVTVSFATNGGTSRFSSGYGEWQKGGASFGTYVDQPAAASGAWTSDDTLVIKQCFTETPYYVLRKLRFEGNQLFYDAEANVGFRNTKQPQLTGRAE
jgi:hypothetical protein